MDYISNCRNCGAPINPDNKTCRYCGTFWDFEDRKNLLSILKNRQFRKKGIYPFLIIAGILIVVYVYGMAFDDFSETQLIGITPIWFFLIIFGVYGYVAEKLLRLAASRNDSSISDSFRKWMSQILKRHVFSGLILAIILFPFYFLKVKSSLVISAIGSFIWGILLLIFFNGIFPAL